MHYEDNKLNLPTLQYYHRRQLKLYYSCLKQIVLYFASFVTFTILLITYIVAVGSLDSNLIDPSCDQFHCLTFSTVCINKSLFFQKNKSLLHMDTLFLEKKEKVFTLNLRTKLIYNTLGIVSQVPLLRFCYVVT